MANAKCETCRFFDEHKGNGAVAHESRRVFRRPFGLAQAAKAWTSAWA